MNSKKPPSRIVDLETWKRKEHFNFFKDYDLPFFSVSAQVDVTNIYDRSKSESTSFFLLALHACLKAVNDLEAFRLRIENQSVVCYDKIDAGATLLLDNQTFKYGLICYHPEFETFEKMAIQAMNTQKKEHGLTPHTENNVIYFSSLPWVSFTGIQHARNFGSGNGIPMIVFGKYFEENKKRLMPVSVDGHHALMDGFHVGKFFELFQQNLDTNTHKNLTTS